MSLCVDVYVSTCYGVFCSLQMARVGTRRGAFGFLITPSVVALSGSVIKVALVLRFAGPSEF